MKKLLVLQVIGWAQIAFAAIMAIIICVSAVVQFVKASFDFSQKSQATTVAPMYVASMVLPPQATPETLLNRDELISRAKPFEFGIPLEPGTFYRDIPIYVESTAKRGNETILHGVFVDKTATTQEAAITTQGVTVRVLDPKAQYVAKKAYSFVALEYERDGSINGTIQFIDRTRY